MAYIEVDKVIEVSFYDVVGKDLEVFLDYISDLAVGDPGLGNVDYTPIGLNGPDDDRSIIQLRVTGEYDFLDHMLDVNEVEEKLAYIGEGNYVWKGGEDDVTATVT
jgi:hypothetical protein